MYLPARREAMAGLLPCPPSLRLCAGARRLACYVREAVGRLAAQDGFERGELAFPDPEQVLVNRVTGEDYRMTKPERMSQHLPERRSNLPGACRSR